MANKYTLEDIIINPNDPRVKIGKEYYFSDSLVQCLKDANNEGSSRELVDVRSDNIYPFHIKDYVNVQCIIRKKEPSYIERQNEWIRKNDIKIGDLVKVTRIASAFESGWGEAWFDIMNKQVGKILRVKRIDEINSGIRLDDNFYYPFFVLEKVKKKYVPFDLANPEDRTKLRGAWVVRKDKHFETVITGFTITDDFQMYLSGNGEVLSPQAMFEKYTFLDGSPCGKLVEVEE